MTGRNPFPPSDPDRRALWTLLVEQDIDAFMHQDWDRIAGDFVEPGFTAIDAAGSADPDDWRLTYGSLEDYRRAWLEQAARLHARCSPDTLREALYVASTLRDVDVKGASALVHKVFAGEVVATDGEPIPLDWRTVYHCTKTDGRWKISGFVGYLPGRSPDAHATSRPARYVPEGAAQHRTAGPYSPVLVVTPGRLVVLSGQASIDPEGRIVGDTFAAQARATLENCRRQLHSAGCDFTDVFKVNVYLTDLADWPVFNEVYAEIMPDPKPVRTAVETRLLPGLLVEIEMWAVTR